MDATWLSDALAYALPSGFVGAVASWVVGRRKRNNDFLAEMQRSIDLLSEKYNSVLQENVALRGEKADWQVLQRELVRKVDRLTREVESLRRLVNLKNLDYETETSITNHRLPPVVRAGDIADGIVRGIPQPDAAERVPDRGDLHDRGDRAGTKPQHPRSAPQHRRAVDPA